ncbi:MAG: MFS transporter [Bacteroidales bacterium]|nr:MFS transporter [Bacteroidales bacterium]
MNNTSLKTRLIVMNFLQFAVWGAYLTSMGNYLGPAGMGTKIAWFYAIQGIVSIFMPTLMGIIADKFIQPQKLLGICHLVAGSMMLGLAYLGSTSPTPNPALFIAIYTVSVAFYMPTLALSNTAAFTILKNHGLDTVTHFPPIRVFGTVGFIATMWFVNCACLTDGSFGFTLAREAGKFQYTYMQFGVNGVLGILLFLYCFTLPACPLVKCETRRSFSQMLGLDAFRLFREKRMALFFIFSMLLGMSLQVTNGYAGPFITHFIAQPEYADSFAANNATLLVSLSQIAEALCILLIPFFLRRFGIKKVMLIAMVAWVLRFGFFGMGDPAFPGVILFILSCIVYGVAFDFFNVSGGLFVDNEVSPELRASGQGLFMLMTNGLGATIGTLSAGAIVDHFCQWTDVTVNGETGLYLIGDWSSAWYIFAGFALVVAVLFALLFREKK